MNGHREMRSAGVQLTFSPSLLLVFTKKIMNGIDPNLLEGVRADLIYTVICHKQGNKYLSMRCRSNI